MIYYNLDITKKYTRRENMQLAEVLEKTPGETRTYQNIFNKKSLSRKILGT